MITWQGLLEDSRRGVEAGTVDSLRRSVSTTYYAVFHALAASNANCLVGTRQTSLDGHAWLRAYRGLDHGDAKKFTKDDIQRFSTPVQEFIGIFRELQDARHMADYNPDSSRVVTPSEGPQDGSTERSRPSTRSTKLTQVSGPQWRSSALSKGARRDHPCS